MGRLESFKFDLFHFLSVAYQEYVFSENNLEKFKQLVRVGESNEPMYGKCLTFYFIFYRKHLNTIHFTRVL